MMKKILLVSIVICFCCRAGAQVIINDYAAVLQQPPLCTNTFLVDAVNGFKKGDTILVIQMKGATVDTTNTAAFGDVLSYNGAGNYEYNVVSAVSGSNITLLYKLRRIYDIPKGKVQFVKIPSYTNYAVSQRHTCLPWTGSKGGVFAINVANTLSLNAAIDVSGRGFRGGVAPAKTGDTILLCGYTGYYYGLNIDTGAQKGEGISTVSVRKSYGRGKMANGGGGGNAHNAGGGGGSNAGAGGIGGEQFVSCGTSPANPTGGIGGAALNISTGVDKLFLGGGGGAGHANNQTVSDGGAGGGMVIIRAGTIAASLSGSINVRGANAPACTDTTSFNACIDGMGGGGGGGTVALSIATYLGNLQINTSGGNGANVSCSGANPSFIFGPGGGGGGGVLWVSGSSVPPAIIINDLGGKNGLNVNQFNDPRGAQPGNYGNELTGLSQSRPTITDTFEIPKFGPVTFSDSVVDCFTRLMTVQAPPATAGMIYHWEFPGGAVAGTRNASFTFPGYGTHTVILTVEFHGCVSVTKTINIPYVHFARGVNDTSTCYGRPVYLNALGGTSYSWSPAAGLGAPGRAYTSADPMSTTVYVVTVTDAKGCRDNDTVVVTVIPPPFPVEAAPADTAVCEGRAVQLHAGGSRSYQWGPLTGLNNPNSANPVAKISESIVYAVTGRDSVGCLSTDTVNIRVKPGPEVHAAASGVADNCKHTFAELKATGTAIKYEWSPATYVENAMAAIVKAFPPLTMVFTLTGYDAEGCTTTDTVTAYAGSNINVFMPDAFTPNGDGRNDGIRPIVYCDFTLDEYRIYNSWGQLVFSSSQLSKAWNGYYDGLPADVGQYFYLIIGKRPSNSEQVLYKGGFTLIR